MLDRLSELERQALAGLEGADEAGLQAWRVRYLGRSAELGEIMEGLENLPKGERPAVGRRANEVKSSLEAAYEARAEALHAAALQRSLLEERLDVTLPGRPSLRGRLHPATQMLREILAIWAEMGFQVYRSRMSRPRRTTSSSSTFPPITRPGTCGTPCYTTTPGILLRTHTSPGQIRVIRERAPEPIRVVLPGMCLSLRAGHGPIGDPVQPGRGTGGRPHITFADLKGTLTAYARRMFGENVRTRFRPATFPSPNPPPRWTSSASCAPGRDAPSARAPAGWRSSAAAWSIRLC